MNPISGRWIINLNRALIALILALGAHAAFGLVVPSLHRAARDGNLRSIERAIARGADVNRQSVMGYTPLYVAALFGQGAIVDILIRAGADLDTVGEARLETALVGAMRGRHLDVARQLLETGADPDAKHEVANPPVFWALSLDEPAWLQLLFEHGADPAATNTSGEPLLFQAIEYGQRDSAMLLLEYGASLSQKTERGQSLDAWLESNGDEGSRALLELLRENAN